MLDGIDDIGHHGAGRREFAGAGPVEHHVADGVAADDDPVHDAVDAGDGFSSLTRCAPHKCRSDLLRLIHLYIYGAAEQFDPVPDPAGIADVDERHGFDAPRWNELRVEHAPEAERREDAYSGTIVPLIRRRVLFGIPFSWGVALRLGKEDAVFYHFRQDVVRRSVEYP